MSNQIRYQIKFRYVFIIFLTFEQLMFFLTLIIFQICQSVTVKQYCFIKFFLSRFLQGKRIFLILSSKVIWFYGLKFKYPLLSFQSLLIFVKYIDHILSINFFICSLFSSFNENYNGCLRKIRCDLLM